MRLLFSVQVLLCRVQLILELLFLELSLFLSSLLNTPMCPHAVVHAAFKCPQNAISSDRI